MDPAVSVGVVAKRGDQRAQRLADRLASSLESETVSVAVDASTASEIGRSGSAVADLGGVDLLVSVGGDGTFLFAAREADGAPLVGVNLGEVGFLTAVEPDRALDVVSSLVEQRRTTGRLETRSLQRIRATGADWTLDLALNEVVVQGTQRGPAGGVRLTVDVDGTPYLSTTADGVLVATPTGSTAYNLSERGPLTQPSVEAMLVTPMAPDVAAPPLVVAPEAVVSITIEPIDTDDGVDPLDGPDATRAVERAVVVGDGRARRELDLPTTLAIERADRPVRVAGPSVDFFRAIEKLR